MATKYIKVGSKNAELIPVIDVYAFIYESEKGKTVLRIRVADSVKNFDELRALFSGDVPVYAYEETIHDLDEENGVYESKTVIELKSEHLHFCKDYKCDYSATKGEYFIEITRKTDSELLSEQNVSDTLIAYAAIGDLYELGL